MKIIAKVSPVLEHPYEELPKTCQKKTDST